MLERLDAIEEKVAHLERALNELSDVVARQQKELDRALEHLVLRAQDAGAVRSDVGMVEIRALLNSIHHATERERGDGRMAMRLMAVICDGLRVVDPARSGSQAS